jgi:hypothetical protein
MKIHVKCRENAIFCVALKSQIIAIAALKSYIK